MSFQSLFDAQTAAIEARLRRFEREATIDASRQIRGSLPNRNLAPLNLLSPTLFTGILGLARGGTNADLSATGPGVLQQLGVGDNITVGPLAFTSIDWASGSADDGQPLLYVASGPAAAFGPLNLANTDAVTGVLPAANGGTGVNNSTRTLTISTNGGTLAFSAASKTLTIPDTGTAALIGLAQTFSANQTIAANLIFSGTGRRITGDMTSATFADRLAFQSSTTNGTTALSVLPNGTATTGSIVLFNASDPDNASRLALNATATAIQFSTNASGTGSQLPMSFLTGGAQRMEINGANIGLCTTAGSYGASSVGVIGISNRTTAPTGNPTGGGVLYAAAGAGTWRGSGGTITAFGPAGPHCGACGYDAWTVAMRNDAWRAYCYICGHCGASYRAGPHSVLGRLGPDERAQIIRPGMTYDAVTAMLN